MSPSDLSWLQGCLFFFLGVAASYGLQRCQNRRTNHGTSDVELRSIHIENEISTTQLDSAESSGGNEDPSGPSQISSPLSCSGPDEVDDVVSQPLEKRPRRRRAFNQFLQASHSPVLEDTSQTYFLPELKRFNGVRYRTDRRIWVAEMKPPKHKTKQDFGNFKSQDEAARAVDAAFHYYGKPHLLNFPDTSLQFFSTRPTAPGPLDEKAKVKFVKEEAKLLLAAIAASFPLHSH